MKSTQQKSRYGRFTSSEIVALTILGDREMTEAEKKAHKKLNPKSTKKLIKDINLFSDAGHTYIQETKWEKLSQLPLESDVDARDLTWGKLAELFVSENVFGTEYESLMDVVFQHPEIEYYAGSPDFLKHSERKIVSELKCPKTRKSYFIFYDCADITAVRKNHPQGEKFYWQTVSNGILTGCDVGELVFFMPYKSQLEDMRKMARHSGEDKYNWIARAENDNSLPYVMDSGYYQNKKAIEFEIPKSDKEFLITRIEAAGKILNA